MKRFFITSMFAWVALLVFSQDVIVKKDGSIVQAKVTKVGSSEVEYKKWSNIDGPSYCIDISEILAINYQNGEKDTFDKVSNSNNTPQQVSKPAAANNQNLIDSYKTDFHIKKQKQKSDPADDGLFVFNFTPNSILSNEDLEISFVRSTATNKELSKYIGEPLFRYEIVIKNKTNQILYVDLANCFRMPSIGNSYCYYNGESTTVTKGKSNGVGVNMGGVANALGAGGAVGSLANGVTVAGGSSSSVSKSYDQQRVITIPPHGHRALSQFHYEQTKNGTFATFGNFELTSKGEEFCFKDFSKVFQRGSFNTLNSDFWNLRIKQGLVNKDEDRTYTPENSPFTINYVITYSASAAFDKFTTLEMCLYTSRVIGHEINRMKYGDNIYFNEKLWLKEFDIFNSQAIIGPIKFEK